MVVRTEPIQTISMHAGCRRAKHIFVLIFTLLILVPVLFVMAVVALVIRLDAAGLVVFRQRRVGLNRKEFYLLKFRS